MICSPCGQDLETAESAGPCPHCGANPLLDGRYRLDRVLGRGGTGVTYAATRLEDGVTVAIKEMPLRAGVGGTGAAKAREMIEREVRVLRQLHHPQIPAHIEDMVTGSGKSAALHLVQEFIPGEDLAHEMASHRYDESEVLDVLIAILPVFVYLHGLSPPVIHRDVKPRNIMRARSEGGPGVDEAGARLVLLDFGAVRDAVVDRDLGGSTVAGTFGYMAPEQFRGDATPATDIYGLGALAVALLTRKEPHTLADASGALAWRKHARVSGPVGKILDRMLCRAPEQRPDARQLGEDLRRLRAQVSGQPRPEGADPDDGRFGSAVPADQAARLSALLERDGLGAAFAAEGRVPDRAGSDRFYQPPATTGGDVASTLPVMQSGDRSRPIVAVGAIAAGGLGALLLIGGLLAAAAGVGALALTSEPSAAPVQVPTPSLPIAPLPVPSCTIARPTVSTGSSTSNFQFIAATPDGSEVALALGRQSDKRAEVIDYKAGARRAVSEWVLSPRDVPSSWTDLVAGLQALNKSEIAARGMEMGTVPVGVDWCQSGGAVQIGDETWNWRIVEDSCGLGVTTNLSFELCPPGATDAEMCARPTRLSIGCSDVEPRLVDVFELGNAVWVVAERPGSTTPRFAGGVMRGE